MLIAWLVALAVNVNTHLLQLFTLPFPPLGNELIYLFANQVPPELLRTMTFA